MVQIWKASIVTFSMLIASICFADSDSNIEQFLAKPTGQYGVGFRDFHFQDNTRCPDIYTQSKFGLSQAEIKYNYSENNARYCREIMTRVYYPTNGPVSIGSSPYYPPFVEQTENENEKIIGILGQINVPAYNQPISVDLDYSQLRNLKTYSHENVPAIQGATFPIVFFTPGAGNQIQQYENIITNLVSHGYIVIGVNSFYLTGAVALPNGNVVTQDFSDNPDTNTDINTRTSDIMYVYSQLPTINSALSNSLNLKEIGLMGHSDGANAVASIMSSNNSQKFAAAIAMDADIQKEFQSFSKPFLHELSGSRYWVGWYGSISERVPYMPKYSLAGNNYLVAIVPDLDSLLDQPPIVPTGLYSVHGSFSDWTTLQKTDAFQSMLPIYKLLNPAIFSGNTLGYEYGIGDGMDINNSINTYNLQFFDTYLKDKPNPVFNNTGCEPLSANTIISCGPTTFPYG